MHDIVTVDTHYLGRPQFAAAYLLLERGRAAFIDNNTNAAVPRLLTALAEAGLSPTQVDYLIVSHVHLDHAGGTSALAAACPEATVVAHPRAARHLIDPAKLVGSAKQVYGEETFERLYGEIGPIPAARVEAMEDGAQLDFAGRTLTFLHTRGHANHHFCIVDGEAGDVFTGDAFGLIYPELQGEGTFALPSTSPTDFDPDLARDAVRRIAALRPRRVFPTHFGAVTDVDGAAAQLLRHLDFAEALMREAEAGDDEGEALVQWLRLRLGDYVAGLLDRVGDLGADAATWHLLQLDLDLNAQGIAHTALKRRKRAREGGG